MKKLILLLAVLIPAILFAQKAKIEFQTTSHNFGTISENGGKATFDFSFKNTGTAPLLLTNVRAGCGCTTSEWNRQPVAPGASSSIKVSFDPRNRPGLFVKSVTVNSNAENSTVSLVVRGNVSRKPLSPYENYKVQIGPIRVATNNVNFGTIKNTEHQERKIQMINTSAQPATIQVISKTPGISAVAESAVLKKNQKGTIQITYDATQKGDWGFSTDFIEIKVNNQVTQNITVAAHIQEDFSQYKENPDKVPVIHLSENEALLEGLEKNSTKIHEFFIQNIGKSDLIIRKINTSDDNISVNVAKTTIRPGKKAKAIITLKTTDQPKIIKIVRFIVNDPKNPAITYKVTGNLK